MTEMLSKELLAVRFDPNLFFFPIGRDPNDPNLFPPTFFRRLFFFRFVTPHLLTWTKLTKHWTVMSSSTQSTLETHQYTLSQPTMCRVSVPPPMPAIIATNSCDFDDDYGDAISVVTLSESLGYCDYGHNSRWTEDHGKVDRGSPCKPQRKASLTHVPLAAPLPPPPADQDGNCQCFYKKGKDQSCSIERVVEKAPRVSSVSAPKMPQRTKSFVTGMELRQRRLRCNATLPPSA